MDEYFLTCPRGLEEITKKQISKYLTNSVSLDKGGVYFKGIAKDMYTINIYSRTGMRLLKKLFSFKIQNDKELYKKIYNFNWSNIINVKNTFSIKTKLKSTLFNNTNYTTLIIKDAIVDQIRNTYGKRPSIDKINPDIGLFVFININQVTIYINTSGEPLFKRGYRNIIHKASLNEALSAGLILLSNWDAKKNFYDIMCGSGTIPIEAAMIAFKIPPGILRKNYAFQKFNNYNKTLFKNLIEKAKNNITINDNVKIYGSDHIKQNIDLAIQSASQIGINNNINFSICDINDVNPDNSSGILIINPPYGNRMGNNIKINDLYKELGDIFKNKYIGYDTYIFSGNLEAIKSVGLKSKKRIILKNGKIDCRLIHYPISYGKFNNYNEKKY